MLKKLSQHVRLLAEEYFEEDSTQGPGAMVFQFPYS